MPVGGTPAAVVLVRFIVGEDEPAALHFGGARTAGAGQLITAERQAHVLGRVAMQIVDPGGAHAVGKSSGRERIRAAGVVTAAGAAGGLVAVCGTQRVVLLGAIGPDPLSRGVVRAAHGLSILAPGVFLLRWLQRARAGALPLVGITQAFADRLAELRRLARADVH